MELTKSLLKAHYLLTLDPEIQAVGSETKIPYKEDYNFYLDCLLKCSNWAIKQNANSILFYQHIFNSMRSWCSEQITEHQYIKVNYVSTIDWRETTDHLQCNLSFFGKLCYDCVLIQHTPTMVSFIHFLLIFSCHIPDLDGSYDFTLVQPYSMRTGVPCRLDCDLDLVCVRTAPQSSSIFIPTASIIRRAILAPNTQNRDDYIAISYLNSDMFLCLKDATNFGLQNEV